MGYFDYLLRRLQDEFKDIWDQEEFLCFKYLFEQECTTESLPRQFTQSIELLAHLLKMLQGVFQGKHKKVTEARESKENKLYSYDAAAEKTKKGNVEAKRRKCSLRIPSKLTNVPLCMVSTSLSYLPITNSTYASKYGSRFYLDAAITHIKLLTNVEVTFDATKREAAKDSGKIEIKNARIASMITHLRFTGVADVFYAKRMLVFLSENTDLYKNLIKMTFGGEFSHCLVHFDKYPSLNTRFVNCLNNETKNCRKLKYLEFIAGTRPQDWEYYPAGWKRNVAQFHKKFEAIEVITLRSYDYEFIFEHRLYEL